MSTKKIREKNQRLLVQISQEIQTSLGLTPIEVVELQNEINHQLNINISIREGINRLRIRFQSKPELMAAGVMAHVLGMVANNIDYGDGRSKKYITNIEA